MIRVKYRFIMTVFMAFLASNIPHVAAAEVSEHMISTMDVVETLSREQTEQKVRAFLDRDDVKKEFVKLGVSPEEISLRMASLSNQELNRLATQMEQAQYGGDVVGILVVVLLVILIIYLVKRL